MVVITTTNALATLAATVPTDMQLNKRLPAQSKKLISCPDCTATSPFITLLILLSQELITSYEHIIAN
jgi:hypothetical protein